MLRTMSSYYWTRTAVLILVAGVVLAAGDVINRHVRDDSSQAQGQSPSQAQSTKPGSPTPSSTTLAPDTSKNCTSTNDTDCKVGIGASGGISRFAHDNAGMLTRTFYVLLAVTSIIVVYFIIRAVRIRNRKSRTKRYGVISTNDDRMEMTPLDEDDDDEDLTVFEANGRLIK